MSKVRMFINGLFASKSKLRGVDALTLTMINTMRIVDDLNNQLIDANEQSRAQADKVRAEKIELDRIEDLIDKGETFLTGLKGLFGITD